MTHRGSASRVPHLVAPDGLRHRPFLEALADGEPTSAGWLAARAGLLVLRYLDAWATGEWLPVQLMAERSAVADAICEVPAGNQFRSLLAVLLERTTADWTLSTTGEPQAQPASVARIASPLLAYAHALQFSSQWAMAADAYHMVWDACSAFVKHPSRALVDADSATTAALRLGACYRTLGDPGRATAAYDAAFAVASHRGDERSVLQVRLGKAKLILDRGNFPLADERIRDVIRDAASAQLLDIRAWAFHDRSLVAYQRGQFRAAAEWGFEAWAIERNPRERERVLCDLALALLGAGYRELARTADRLLAITGKEPLIRWAAMINLIEIATIERDETEYNRLRQTLSAEVLPPAFSANYHYYVGQAEATFGRHVRACKELERAIAMAEQHGLGELVIKAEAALVSMRDGQTSDRRTAAIPVPPEFAHISDALHGACVAAMAEAT